MKWKVIYAGEQIKAYFTAPNFEGVDASNAVELTNDGNLKAQDLAIRISGSSKVNPDLNAAIVTKSSGSSEIHLKGQAVTMWI